MKRAPPDPRSDAGREAAHQAARDSADRAAQRSALRRLKRAQAAAAKAGVDLSEWEGEFLGSVTERVETYGRAFGDPEFGSPGQALSALQTRKLKEITAKAKGEPLVRRGFKPGRQAD